MNDIINVEKINSYLDIKGDKKKIEAILDKALELKGLENDEVAALLNLEDENSIQKLFNAAKTVKEKIYGKRIVFFAPLYVSNHCCNNCLYCGFRHENKELKRRILSVEEAVKEAEKIIQMGHKRILLVAGEDLKMTSLDYTRRIVEGIYADKIENGEIRRLNLNLAPLSVAQFKEVSSWGIGTFQVFQETYHPEVYKKMHPSGPKSNYNNRLEVWDRAIEGGIKDFGVGALFGLYDYRFEVLALIEHSKYLLNKYGVGPHTISVPRIEPAEGSDLSQRPPYEVLDKQFKKIIAVLRLAVPYTGMILTTRENPDMRRAALEFGITQVSAGSRTNPGGYSEETSTAQFVMADDRSLDTMVRELSQTGFIPSFCTSCYRLGRVGVDFMPFAREGSIHKFCDPNAISTFAEYLNDYASPETKAAGFAAIKKHIEENFTNENLKAQVNSTLERINSGERDIYV
ncbi:MAG: [FeFe] hydrogenase H-cluster radical SAM maturase HydG [Candidatus Gastranaerophilaceae bacterium]